MNKPLPKPQSVTDYKIQAAFLLKAFCSTDKTKREAALKRLQRLPEFTVSFS